MAAGERVRDEEAKLAAVAHERTEQAATFRSLAAEWLEVQERRRAKPSYLRNCRSMLAEPGQPHRRGPGTTKGRLMAAFGNRDPRSLTTDEIERFLLDAGLSNTNYNRHRDLLLRIVRHAHERDRLPDLQRAVKAIERVPKRQEDDHRDKPTYSPAEIQRIAAALGAGQHRRRPSRLGSAATVQFPARASPRQSHAVVAAPAESDRADAVSDYAGRGRGRMRAVVLVICRFVRVAAIAPGVGSRSPTWSATTRRPSSVNRGFARPRPYWPSARRSDEAPAVESSQSS